MSLHAIEQKSTASARWRRVPEIVSASLVHIDTTSSNDTESYVAGLWHHDRVGNRLKAFVFLHDVDCDEGHPTEVVVGSHLLNYYRTDAMGASRFIRRTSVKIMRSRPLVAQRAADSSWIRILYTAPVEGGRCRGRSSSGSTTRPGNAPPWTR